jgi:hypothetical protein
MTMQKYARVNQLKWLTDSSSLRLKWEKENPKPSSENRKSTNIAQISVLQSTVVHFTYGKMANIQEKNVFTSF